jgi:hypothetical protein
LQTYSLKKYSLNLQGIIKGKFLQINPTEDFLHLREYDFKGMNSLQVISLRGKGLLRE